MEKICKILILSTMFTMLSCDGLYMDETNGVKVSNNSDENIYTLCVLYKPSHFCKVEILTSDSLFYESIYIKKGEKKLATEWTGPSAEKIMKSTDTISLFILSKEEYEGKTWSQLVDSGKFLVYHLSGDDIRRLGSCVPFPPTSKMCDMVMEPACQE